MAFDDSVRIQCLLWCDRHCCLCKKPCGVDIELHHISPNVDGGPDDIDNAIPLCFDCHAKVEHYNHRHPRGTKFRPDELRQRREQIYEEFTKHLVPPISYRITQCLRDGTKRALPDVGFFLEHMGRALPVRAWVTVDVKLDDKTIERPAAEYYCGKKPWRLNPLMAHHGHFELPGWHRDSNARIEVEVAIDIEDCYKRRHSYLPVGFVYKSEIKDWYFEP